MAVSYEDYRKKYGDSINSYQDSYNNTRISTNKTKNLPKKNKKKENIGDTLKYLGTKVAAGAVSVPEGIADFGGSILKGAGKVTSKIVDNPVGKFVFGKDAADYQNNPLYQIGENMSRDEIANTVSKEGSKAFEKKSYAKDGSLASNVAQGVGQVAGMIATGKVLGGKDILPKSTKSKTFNTIAKSINNPSTQTMFLSTAGNSYNEALKDGANEKDAFLYGLLEGSKESATEMMYGGLGKAFGKGTLDDVVKKTVTNKMKNAIAKKTTEMGIGMAAEGVEEVASTILEPFVSYVYKHKLNFNDYNSILSDFVSGALVSGITQGGEIAISKTAKKMNKLTETDKSKIYSNIVDKLAQNNKEGFNKNSNESIQAQANQIVHDIETANDINLNEENRAKINNLVYNSYIVNEGLVNPKEVVDSFLKENSNYSTLSKQETDNNQLTKITDSLSQNSDIQPYTNQEIENYKNGKVKIAINENDISSFIESAKKIPSNAKLYFGKISENLSNRIKQTINLDLNNYNISLKADSIRHILRKHGNNSEILRGQIPVNPEDFKLIPQIISNYDSVETSGTTNEGKPAITFSKKFGNNYYLVTYVSDKNHNLEVQTMWKQKKNPATADNTIKSPIQTSETDSGTGSSNIDNTTNLSKSQNIVLPTNNMQQNKNKKPPKSANSNISKDILKITPENNSNLPKLPRIERTNKYNGESKFYDNIRDKTNMLNENQKNAILDEDEIKYYDKVSNNESLEKAQERLKSKPHAIEEWFRQDSKNATSIDVAEGWILMKKYADANDTDGMVEVAKKMRDIGTKAGQTVQAFNIMERMSPEGMVKYAQTELLDAFDELSKNKTKKWIDTHRDEFELKPEDVQLIKNNMNDIKNLEDGYEKRVKLAEIQKMMTDKIPSNMGKKIKSWMRISMLFNPKTQVRNVAGNALIAPINSFSDLFSSYADKIVAKKTGIRTTGNTNIKATLKGIKKGAYESTNDFRKGINTKDMEGNRFEIGEGKSFSEKNIIGRNLNRVESLLNYVMDIGDRVFSQAAFENSLQNQMILNGTSEVTQEMLDIARTESLQRTWNDNNNYTKSVLKIREILNAGQNYGIGDILIPFAKTPANLTKAIVDYSPVGMLQTIKDGANLKKSLSNGQHDAKLQHKFVQEFGKATAGTMLYIAGIALAKAKITSGDSDDDKDVANFIKNTLGTSSYSIKIGGKSFAYDWAQPLAAPLSITANIVNKNYQNKDARKLIETIVDSLDTGSNLLLEQSFAQSIKDVLSDNDGIASGIIKEILDLPARAIPTFAKQIAELTDGTQRQTYEYNAPIKSAFNSVKAKLPGLSKTLNPSVDTMGRDIQKYGGKNNIFNVFLNPANVNTENISKSAKEIYDIYKETGDKTIMPRVAPYYLNKKNEKIILTSEQRTKFQKLSGEIIEKNVQKLLNSKEYKNMDSMTKAEVIKDIVNYSYNISQKEILDGSLSKSYEKAYEYSKIGNISDYYTFKNSIDDDNKKESISNYLTNSNLNNKQLAMLYGSYYSSEETLNNLLNMNIPIKEFIKIDSMDVKGIYNTATGKTINGSKQNEYITNVNKLKLTIPQKAILIKMKYSSYKKYDNQIVNYVNSINTSVNDKKLMLTKIGFKNYYKDVVEYINSQNISKKNKEKKLKSLGFTIKDGRVYW